MTIVLRTANSYHHLKQRVLLSDKTISLKSYVYNNVCIDIEACNKCFISCLNNINKLILKQCTF